MSDTSTYRYLSTIGDGDIKRDGNRGIVTDCDGRTWRTFEIGAPWTDEHAIAIGTDVARMDNDEYAAQLDADAPNEERADRGGRIVETFTDRQCNTGETFEEALAGLRGDISDAMADLLHLGERYGLEADDLLDKARLAWFQDSEDGKRVQRRDVLCGRSRVPERTKVAAVIHLRADNDVNGNPRRAFALFADGGEFIATLDEGYNGTGELYERYPETREIWPVQVDVSVGEYKRFLRRLPHSAVVAVEASLEQS